MHPLITSCLTAVAAVLGMALAYPGQAKPAPVPVWVPAQVGADGTSLGFTMAKWLDAKGTEKATVAGTFRRFTVALNKPVRHLRTLVDLKGLKGRVSVDLTSLETGNPARDLNITQTYFETGRHPQATILLDGFRTVATPDNRLAVAQEADVRADGTIELHGMKRSLAETRWHVAKRPEGILVTSQAPVTLASADFGLPAAALMKVCNHLGLDPAAAVTVSLLLKP